MEITIKAEPKEIAAPVLALHERQKEITVKNLSLEPDSEQWNRILKQFRENMPGHSATEHNHLHPKNSIQHPKNQEAARPSLSDIAEKALQDLDDGKETINGVRRRIGLPPLDEEIAGK